MHAFDLVIDALAAAPTAVAYPRDPGLPAQGAKVGGQLFLDILPRLLGSS